MSENIAVLLGCENDDEENLLDIAISRADAVITLLQNDPALKVIPTGAFGDFNMSNVPHAELPRRYLVKNGIGENRILPFTRSSNTVEDSYGVLQSVSRISNVQKITIVTSEFHMARVKYIFGRVLQGYNVEYFAVPDTNTSRVEELRKSETNKIISLEKEWVNIAGFDLSKFPEKCYENLGYELRHYDNLSYYALAGAVIYFGFVFDKTIFGDSKFAVTAQCLVGIIIVSMLSYLYHRFADTSSAARRVMKSMEKLYGVPGLSSTKMLTKIFKLNLKAQEVVDLLTAPMIVGLLIKALVVLLKK